MKVQLKILIVIILNLTLSCSIKKMDYDRGKIEKKYSDNYDVMIDSNRVDFNNVFLDKENIKLIQINKRKKVINITQYEKRNLEELKNLRIDSLNSNLKKLSIDGLIVFNGNPIPEFKLDSCQIVLDSKSINEFSIVTKARMDTTSTWYNYKGDLIIISTD